MASFSSFVTWPCTWLMMLEWCTNFVLFSYRCIYFLSEPIYWRYGKVFCCFSKHCIKSPLSLDIMALCKLEYYIRVQYALQYALEMKQSSHVALFPCHWLNSSSCVDSAGLAMCTSASRDALLLDNKEEFMLCSLFIVQAGDLGCFEYPSCAKPYISATCYQKHLSKLPQPTGAIRTWTECHWVVWCCCLSGRKGSGLEKTNYQQFTFAGRGLTASSF